MILPVDIQIYYFIYTLIAGLGLGIMYDIYRIIRGFNAPRKFMTAISDMLFWILSAILVFIFLLYTNYGDLGYYTFIGIFLGLLVYFRFISRRFLKNLRWILYHLFKGLRMLVIMIMYPFKLLNYGTRLLFAKTGEGISQGVKGSREGLKKIFRRRKQKEGKKKSAKNKDK